MATEFAYKSPSRKLAQFFERSRDQWKAKCEKRKRLCRKLSNQVRAVEASRERWKLAAQQAKREASQAKKEVSRLRQELEDQKKGIAKS